ncbi:hypothetical protein ACP275_12G000700 [Erythranthe tilingii]
MVQKTVLRVNDISCHKCKTKLLKAVSGLQGVDKVEVDGAKGTMSVTGDADPYEIIVRTRRKTGKFAEVVSIGPPPKPDDNKKPEEKEKPGDQKAHIHIPFTCPICERIPFIPIMTRWEEPTPQCHIL